VEELSARFVSEARVDERAAAFKKRFLGST
jgi:hypothetical protein